jgi:DNA recombination protein RmuC
MNTAVLALLVSLAVLALVAVGLTLLMLSERRRANGLAERLQAATIDLARERERTHNLEDSRTTLADLLKAQAGETARTVADQMVARAAESIRAQELIAQGRIDAQLKPVADTLSKFEAHVTALEAQRNQEQGGLKEQIAALMQASALTQDEARKLSSALRRGAGIQGRWGEQMLRNVLEMSGLRPGVDFEEQASVADEDGMSRPDVLVRLPGKSFFIVDSKVSLNDYQAFIAAPDEAERELALKAHVDSIRRHLRQLSGKAYWAKFDKPPLSRSPDVVVMFVPSESAFACAVERHPTLVAEGWENRVAIVTPSAMFPLLRAVAYGWRAEDQAANAREIADAGRELHKRVSVIAKYAADLGGALDKAVRHYNDFTGSLDRNVLTQAKRMETLGAGSERTLADVPALDVQTRPLVKLAAVAAAGGEGRGEEGRDDPPAVTARGA